MGAYPEVDGLPLVVERQADPGFRYTATLAKVLGVSALRLANADALPVDPHGARQAQSWLATDLNPETLAIAKSKPLPPGTVSFATVRLESEHLLPEQLVALLLVAGGEQFSTSERCRRAGETAAAMQASIPLCDMCGSPGIRDKGCGSSGRG